jgi:hypothetical protein
MRFTLTITLLAFLGAGGIQAATITAQASNVNIGNTGPLAGQQSVFKFGSGVTWFSGLNIADGKQFPKSEQGFDPYALGDPTNGIFGYNFNGYGKVDEGPLGSLAITKGDGHSTTVKQPDGVTRVDAQFTATASGTLGKAKNGQVPEYFAVSQGRDPWFLDPADFSGLTGPDYNLYFAAGIGSATYSSSGGIGFEVSYQTAAGSEALLQIVFSGASVSVTNDSPAGLSIFRLTSIDQSPGDITGSPLTLSAIQALLESSLAGGHNIDTPILFGFFLNNVPIPTVSMSDGSVAGLHVDIAAQEAATAPEPGSYVLLASGLLLVARLRRKGGASRVASGNR